MLVSELENNRVNIDGLTANREYKRLVGLVAFDIAGKSFLESGVNIIETTLLFADGGAGSGTDCRINSLR